ncbi:MAG TPA: hypothetical protein VGM90_03040 [Kofleriaceae bacterium]|jgi:hypothetical protein
MFAKLLILAAATLGFEHTAHAMGCDDDAALVAWNKDGSAALLEEHSMCQGDRGTTFSIVDVTGTTTVAVLSHTSRTNGADVDSEAAADCNKAARSLANDLTAHHFLGVTVSVAACKGDRQKIVGVSDAAKIETDRTWIALPQGRTPTTRERMAWDAVRAMQADWAPFAVSPKDDCSESHGTIDAASKSDKLVLVFASVTCDSPLRVRVTGFATGKRLELWPVIEP